MSNLDKVFQSGDADTIWQKYCGFLDLSLDEFMKIQEELLLQQIEVVADSPLAKRFMPERPHTVDEFRASVKFTTYDDYADDFRAKNNEILAVKPLHWVRTSGTGGNPKWVPFTKEFIEMSTIYNISTLILSCAKRRGEVNVGLGCRALQVLPPEPYGAIYHVRPVVEKAGVVLIPDPDDPKYGDFAERMRAGFGIALGSGVDILASLSSVLVKMGERFTDSSQGMKFSWGMLKPRVAFRLTRAWLRSKLEHRSMLPKDLWPLKGLVVYGMDTDIYRDTLIHYWGQVPFQMYLATECGMIGTQAWNKKDMTFTPSASFREFIPEEESRKSREDPSYQPSTVLVDELEPGQIYEVVLTSTMGMPFLRYRIGDLIQVTALEDEETGIRLPQFRFYSRADDLIDMSGFARLDEKAVWQIMTNAGVRFEDWAVRKEFPDVTPILHLYIEPKEQVDAKELAGRLQDELLKNPDYKDLHTLLQDHPLQVTVLSSGTFMRYYEQKRDEGADLGHLKPKHMSPSDTVIADLLRHSAAQQR